jgi:predicted amidophosphoribosyltransferase
MALSAHWEMPGILAARLPGLYQPRGTSMSCLVCRGPLRPGYTRCYQCTQHLLLGEGSLADVVAPVSYAMRGTAFALALARYKSTQDKPAQNQSAQYQSAQYQSAQYQSAQNQSGQRDEAEALLALLLAFLRDHGPCVWRQADMPAPGLLAVVPSGWGRQGTHPLLRLVAPRLRMPLVPLTLRHGEQGRDLNASRFVAGPTEGADVLLLDDTWVSGASIQSAAVALKRAGAGRVAAVVLGRYLNPAEPRSAALATQPYEPGICVFQRQ